MKKIKLKFYGLGYNDINQAYIKIYDINNNLIYEGQTYNNEIIICLNENNIYNLYAYTCYETLNKSFYVYDQYEYNFIFNNIIYDNTITFLLTDYNYSNLPIERGEITLWQKQ